MSKIKAPKIQQPETPAPKQEPNNALRFLKTAKRNIFKKRRDAEKFLKTPLEKEKKMILWAVRTRGKNPCYMVDTPERIKSEKKRHAQFKKMAPWQKKMAIMFEVTGIAMVAATLAAGDATKSRGNTLKEQYAKSLDAENASLKWMPSPKANAVLELFSNLGFGKHFKSSEVRTNGTDIYVTLFGIRSNTQREDLDLFDIKLHIFLTHNNQKVRHLGFRIYDADRRKDKNGRQLEIKVPGKTGGGGAKLVYNRLRKALRNIEEQRKPKSQWIKNLYALTSMPTLRKVLPEVEAYLKKLYPLMFSIGDYEKWAASGILRELEEVLHLKAALPIPPKQSLAPGVDETETVVNCLIYSLEGWLKEKGKRADRKAAAELMEKFYGKKGTPKRDAYEAEVQKQVECEKNWNKTKKAKKK